MDRLFCTTNGNSVEHSYDKDNDLHTFTFRHGKGWSVTEVDKNFDDALIRVFQRVYPTEKPEPKRRKEN